MTKYNPEIARWMGQQASIKNHAFRVSPFYEERAIRDGKRVDVTKELDEAYFAGYDEEQKIKLQRREKNEIPSISAER